MNTRSFILSALIAGIVTGLLGNLPVLNFINCFICLWVWVGGFFAVFLYRRFQKGGTGLSAGQGAGLGAVTGLIGALFGTLVYITTSALSMPLMNRLAEAFDLEGDLPFKSSGPWGILGPALVFLVLDLILYPAFGAVSGLITAKSFWKEI